MEEPRKGTVTSLASLFPVEETQKAVKRIQDAIVEKQSELNHLRGFAADSNNLINLVHKLPEELSHNIMVPFGKAAFFPGRLIHTNEFLVLLGEGYYAERTSKQTVDILKRRGNALDSQIGSLEAMIKDLQAEASFFNNTASEAAEGLVEIREDYVEEEPNKGESKTGSMKQDSPNLEQSTADDKEYARMMSRLDELEKEELAAESGNHNDQNEETTNDVDDISHKKHVDSELRNSEDFHQGTPLDQNNTRSTATEFANNHNNQDVADQLNFAGLAVHSNVGERRKSAKNVKFVDHSEKLPIQCEENTTKAATPSTSQVQHQTSQPSFDSSKAFTGSIIEHTENLKTTPSEPSSTSSQVSGSQPSKPVSRFKMQRRKPQ